MALHVLCASHIEFPERLKTLVMMVKSLKRHLSYVDFYLSISCDDGFDVWPTCDEIKTLVDNFHVFVHDEHLYQFAHYECLFEEFTFANDDKIMFMDDDDLLISAPPITEDIATGVHAIPDSSDLTIDDYKFNETDEDVQDFSGTIVKVSIAKLF